MIFNVIINKNFNLILKIKYKNEILQQMPDDTDLTDISFLFKRWFCCYHK
jgi:hypothetical protein